MLRGRPIEMFSAVALPLALMMALAGVGPSRPAEQLGPHPGTDGLQDVSFLNDLMPILERSCLRCHGGLDEGEVRVESGLTMTTYDGLMTGSEYGEVVTAGDPAGSVLIDMVETGDMPEEGDPLTPAEIDLFKAWISEGARNN